MRTPFMKHATFGWLRASALRPVLMTLLLGSLAACGQQLVQFQDGDADAAANDADASADIDLGVVPSVLATVPTDGSGNVALQQPLSATFSVAMDPTSLADAFVVRQGTTILAGSVSVVGAKATFVPTDPLPIDAVCTATITDQAKSAAGRPMAAAYQWSFSTTATLDVTAPKLSSTAPAHQESNVALAGTVRATFSEAMDPLTLTAVTFLLKRGSAAVAGSVSFDVDNNIAVFTPDAAFEAGTTYTAQITASATDLAGNPLEGGLVPSTWTFTTAFAPVIAPKVTSVSPVHGTISVATNAKITATFDEAMDAASLLAPGAFSVTEGFGAPIAGAVSYDVGSKTATFTPTVDLPHNATISATIGVDVTNLAGVGLVGPYDWQFATHAAPDTTAPLVVFTSPAHGDAAVAFNKVVVATFSEAMNPSSIDGTKVTLAGPGGAIAVVVTYAPASFAVTVAPLQPLKPNTLYTLAILAAGGVQDLAGNTLAVAFSADFTTAATPDTVKPKVSSTNPMALAQGVATGQKLSVTFSEAMDPLTMIGPNVVVTSGAGPTAGIVTFDAANNILHFTPSSPLASGATYTCEITAGAKDLAGNPLEQGIIPNPWTFKTASPPQAAPSVTAVAPGNAATGVAINVKVQVTFSTPMNASTLLAIGTISLRDPQGVEVPAKVSYDVASKTATLTPAAILEHQTAYTATVTTSAKNVAGTSLATPFFWSFTTALTPDTTAPLVTLTAPVAEEQQVAINRKIVATFNEAMNPLTIIAKNVKVIGPLGPIVGLVSYAAGSSAMTFAPAVQLANSATYTVTIAGTDGVTDLAGNAMKNAYSWTFYTAEKPDTEGPQIVVTNPVDGATNVPVDKKVSATFNEPMDPGSMSTLTFKLSNGSNPVEGTVKYDVQSNTVTFSPLNLLKVSTTYTATVGPAAKDLAGNGLAPGVVANGWTFTTAAAPQLGLVIAMGLAEPFAIAATAGVTNTGTTPISHINGDVVLTPDQTCNAVNVDNAGGFGLCGGAAPTINGKVMTNTFPDTTSAVAVKAALNAVFLSITPPAGPPAVGSLDGGALIAGPTTLGGLAGGVLVKNDNWFTPGVYKSNTSILITGDLTLDGQGDSNAQFVFQSASSLTTADGAPSPGAHTRILLINGAKASNVWWQVGSSATMGLYAEFQGNVLAAFDITFKTGATSCGRSMAGAWVGGSGAFVFDSNVISIPGNGCPL